MVNIIIEHREIQLKSGRMLNWNLKQENAKIMFDLEEEMDSSNNKRSRMINVKNNQQTIHACTLRVRID